MSETSNYTCPKCKNTSYEVGEISTTGDFLTKLFDVQNKKFTHVTCARCIYTELYQADSNMLEDIFDLIT